MNKKVIVAKADTSGAGDSASSKSKAYELAARVAYFYPSYTLSEAKRLPARDAMLLIKIARQENAKNYHELLNIQVAPNTKRGAGVSKLLSHYKEVAQQ